MSGKEKCIIFDHSGSVHQLGFPDEIEYDALPGSSDGMTSPVNDAKRREKSGKPKACTQCHYMKPVGVYVCPKCGFKPLGGEDVLVDESRDLTKISGETRIFTREEKQAWWSQIKFYQRTREYAGRPLSDGWCAHLFKSKFGVWPRNLHDTPQDLSPEVQNYIKSRQIAFAKGRARKMDMNKDYPLSSAEADVKKSTTQYIIELRAALRGREINENRSGGDWAMG